MHVTVKKSLKSAYIKGKEIILFTPWCEWDTEAKIWWLSSLKTIMHPDFSLYTVKWLLYLSVWNYKESWAQKNWCFELWCWRRLLKVLWSARRSNYPKEDQPWVYIERADIEAETSILWPPDEKSGFIGKHPDAGKVWRWEEKGMTG